MAEVLHIQCPNCRADDYSLWAEENGFKAVKCKPCGLVYVNPRPSDEMITESHKIGMHQGEEGNLNVKARRLPSKVRRYKKIIRDMFGDEIRAGKPLRWLDVGAGYGEVVEAAAAVLPTGSEASGIEPMAPKAEAAAARGVPVSMKRLEEVGGGYDVISLINVYSHIPDFDSFGQMLVDKLKPGGFLFLETGNLAELRSGKEFPNILVLPDHLVFAGVKQMLQILERLGLTVVEHHKRPVGNLVWTAKTFVKGLMRGKLRIAFPIFAPYRTVLYKARKN
ncbi:MAG: class I SAM-dependent methyltransferase [Allosphingosinicella sp.]|uniref:class I SAM-dependent methyltransferase n=1 Tax=Allosphingosinicella sp. TaxID=2823234 RepID=UPI00391FDCF9